MSRSAGTYTAPSSSFNPAVEGTTIDEGDWNTLLDDIESALTESTYTAGLGSTDNAIARTDGTDTKKLQGSTPTIDDSGNFAGVGYIEMPEASAPSSPAANKGRIYTADDGSGNTRLYYKDSAGTTYTIARTESEALDSIGSTQGNIIYRGASGWAVLAPGTSGQVLQSGGAGANPSWSTAGAGDVLGPAASVDSELALYSSTTGKVLKRATTTGILKGTSGVVSAATAGTDYYNPGGTDVAIADGGTGQSTAAAGFRALADGISTTQGTILYHDATQWTALSPGTSGQLLRTGGAGANPAWATVSGTGDLVAANNLSDVSSQKTSFDNLSVHGADVASASTIDLDAATGNLVDVTGTTTITAITLAEGRERTVRFTGALTLTHGASLVLPGGASITTAAGDYAIFRGYAAGVVRCAVYSKASGAAVVASSSSSGHGQCRLTKSSTNLLLSPYGGNQILINGAAQTVPDAGVTLAATSLSVGTTYNIYVYMTAGTMTLEASTTAHSTDTTTSGNKGVEIKTGDATRTLVGMARIITGPAWVDTDAQRFVISWFNRRTITTTNVFTANRNTTTGSTYTEVNSEIRNEFLTWADESVPAGVAGSGFLNTSGDQVYIGVGFDSATPEQGNLAFQATLAIGPLGLYVTKSGLSEGYHYATVTAKQTVGSAAFTIVSSATGQRTALSCVIRG